MDDFWWEPPMAGTELEHLVGALERLRTTFRWKADDLDAAGLNTRIASSAFQRNVVRSRSRAPTRCSSSVPAIGGSHQ